MVAVSMAINKVIVELIFLFILSTPNVSYMTLKMTDSYNDSYIIEIENEEDNYNITNMAIWVDSVASDNALIEMYGDGKIIDYNFQLELMPMPTYYLQMVEGYGNIITSTYYELINNNITNLLNTKIQITGAEWSASYP